MSIETTCGKKFTCFYVSYTTVSVGIFTTCCCISVGNSFKSLVVREVIISINIANNSTIFFCIVVNKFICIPNAAFFLSVKNYNVICKFLPDEFSLPCCIV